MPILLSHFLCREFAALARFRLLSEDLTVFSTWTVECCYIPEVYRMHRYAQAVIGCFSARAFGSVRKHTAFSVFGALIVVFFVGYRYVSGQETLDSFVFSQSTAKGKRVNAIRGLNLRNKNPDLVYLGSYLVNGQAGCNQCHTCPTYRGINPYKVGGQSLDKIDPINTLNYLAGGTPFENAAIVSPNLTPDSSGLPGGMNYADFSNAMRNGSSFHKPGRILQVMPWPAFRNMNENELVAIYQYLSSLPPASAGTCTGPGETAN
jgi:hypothetical protein